MADKLDLESKDLIAEKLEQLQQLFPNLVTEGENGKVLDFDQLKNEFSTEIVEGTKERYRLEWPGKKEAIVTANLPTTKTLRPVKEDSVDWDTTENLYIEGDNLEVLKILQESYFGKIKMIYIDPPYNTGKDFVYKDNFSKGAQEELEEGGQRDEYNQRLIQNADTSGRYHSDWLSMMYPRLKLARNLLTNDGVIFISIDDNELQNLRKLCDEVFGEGNFIAQMVVLTGANQSGDGIKIQTNTEYCLAVGRDSENSVINRIDAVEQSARSLNDAPTGLESRPDMGYTIYFHPDSGDFFPECDYNKDLIHTNDAHQVYQDNVSHLEAGYLPIRPGLRNGELHRWRWGMDTFIDRKSEVIISKNRNDDYTAAFVQSGFNAPKNILKYSAGSAEVNALFGGVKLFNFPKGTALLSRLIELGMNDGDIGLDFFSGSGTFAHAMFATCNKSLKRRFICVQIPADLNEEKKGASTEVRKVIDNAITFLKERDKPENICEIGKERIRRAGAKIKEETGADIDYGFRVYRLDESNMADVYHTPQDYDQDKLELFADNVKEDRTADDLVAQIMLDWGLPLSLPIEEANIFGKRVFHVAGNSLLACFDSEIDEAFAKEVAKEEPLRIVFKDAGFASDTAKSNVKQLLKQLSPETEMKVI